MKPKIHFKEDTSKPENRVNISLFHLLMNSELKNFVFSKLGLENDCVIYPAPNLETEEFDTTDRPDYKIEKNGKLLGYIEVELGKDVAQVKKYDNKTADNVHVYSIFGSVSDGGNLSLEEIYYFLKKLQLNTPENTQDYWSIMLLNSIIKYYVIDGNFKSNNKRTSLSSSMRESTLIKALYAGIDKKYILDKEYDKPEKGKMLINTVGDSGFSIRVFARNSSSKSFSLMWRTGGTHRIYFPGYVKMNKYIANREFKEKYTDLLISLGCTDIKEITERQSSSLNITTIEENMDEIINCFKLLLF